MGYNILIVNASAAIRKILQRLLRQAGIPIGVLYEAGDGLQAVQVLQAHRIHLVLSDIPMPNMDGISLLRHMQAHPEWRRVPVVMITTEASQTRVLEAVSVGASGYIKKPFTADEIQEKLLPLL